MRIVVDINHPAHVHCFRNFIREMELKGHEVLITATKKDVSLKLLDNLRYRYVNLGSYGDSLAQKLINLPVIDVRMYRAVKKFNPDLFIGLGSIRAAHVAYAMHKKSIIIDDTEISREQMMLFMPFVDTVCTPSNFKLDLGKKQIRFNAYKELAYLHPDYFKPDPGVLDLLGIGKDERFILVRFITWGASHDVGHHGIADRLAFVRELRSTAVCSSAPRASWGRNSIPTGSACRPKSSMTCYTTPRCTSAKAGPRPRKRHCSGRIPS